MHTPEIQLHSFNLFDDHITYVNCFRLYYAYYQIMPSIKTVGNVNEDHVIQWIETEYKDRIIKKHSKQYYYKAKKKMEYDDVIYLLTDQLMIDVYRNAVYILFPESQESTAQQLLNTVTRFIRKEKKRQEIYLVARSSDGLDTSAMKIKKPKQNLSKLYNEDLLKIHSSIVKSLRQKDKGGLFLFHGLPGTGKSTYIRFLIHSINKKVIFMPPLLAGNLSQPDLVKFLIDNRNTVFIIEDAEDLLVSRENSKNSSISMLLNLTDGLLGETLGIQVIATFNTNIKKIDKALLRKGRLMAAYEFKPLCVEKSKQLLEEIGIKNYAVSEPMTLAEIFNLEKEKFILKTDQREAIGFLDRAV